MTTFRALMLHEEGGKIVPRIEAVEEERLPAGEVTVRMASMPKVILTRSAS